MAVHGPDVVATTRKALPNGLSVAFVFDQGYPQGVPTAGQWWRLEAELPTMPSALLVMLPNCAIVTRAETCWYADDLLPSAVAAARAGTLDAWWQGKPSAQWWGGLPVEARAGFTALLASVNR